MEMKKRKRGGKKKEEDINFLIVGNENTPGLLFVSGALKDRINAQLNSKNAKEDNKPHQGKGDQKQEEKKEEHKKKKQKMDNNESKEAPQVDSSIEKYFVLLCECTNDDDTDYPFHSSASLISGTLSSLYHYHYHSHLFEYHYNNTKSDPGVIPMRKFIEDNEEGFLASPHQTIHCDAPEGSQLASIGLLNLQQEMYQERYIRTT
jgi:hypothetical protein